MARDSGSNPSVDCRGEKRTNATHDSSTDPDSRLYKKARGQEAKLSYLGHVLMENRHGLVVNSSLTQATSIAEREAAVMMCDEIAGSDRVTLGGDKNYDVREFVVVLRQMEAGAHVAQNNERRSSAIDGRTTRHPGYEISQRRRKVVEELLDGLRP